MFLKDILKSHSIQTPSAHKLASYSHYGYREVTSRKGNSRRNPLDEILNWLETSIRELVPHSKDIAINNLVLDTPPPHIAGDYTLSTFFLKELFHEDPVLFAKSIATYCSKEIFPLVKKISALGPYINIEVNKELYYKKILDYINDQGNIFGAYRTENPHSVYINCLSNNPRILITSRAIGRHYQRGGHTVFQNNFTIENARLISLGREVINDALKNGLARYVSDTNVILALETEKSPPIILQKQDKSLTKETFNLAHQKKLIKKQHSSSLIYISPAEEMGKAEALIANAQLLGYIDPKTPVSTIFMDQINIDTSHSEKYEALDYAILRVATYKKVCLTKESILIYPRLINLIRQLQENYQESGIMDFSLAKLLITLPKVIASVSESYSLHSLCAYLENIADLCDQKNITTMDKRLSHVTGLVLQNGLNLLI